MHLKSLQPLPHLTVQKGILPQKDLDISWQAAKEPTQKKISFTILQLSRNDR